MVDVEQGLGDQLVLDEFEGDEDLLDQVVPLEEVAHSENGFDFGEDSLDDVLLESEGVLVDDVLGLLVQLAQLGFSTRDWASADSWENLALLSP